MGPLLLRQRQALQETSTITIDPLHCKAQASDEHGAGLHVSTVWRLCVSQPCTQLPPHRLDSVQILRTHFWQALPGIKCLRTSKHNRQQQSLNQNNHHFLVSAVLSCMDHCDGMKSLEPKLRLHSPSSTNATITPLVNEVLGLPGPSWALLWLLGSPWLPKRALATRFLKLPGPLRSNFALFGPL